MHPPPPAPVIQQLVPIYTRGERLALLLGGPHSAAATRLVSGAEEFQINLERLVHSERAADAHVVSADL
ncbi:hypothetical protein GHT09_018355 [Marmota monax]|uniref:Uncharacterized protein n=1 Tax=Marmota monax TaxID=9995 RepID=A0A834Q2V0_MARMO|nr:hypothetical protein GHT09_018355 [Marmota monax]